MSQNICLVSDSHILREVSERLKGLVWKTSMVKSHRRFESCPLCHHGSVAKRSNASHCKCGFFGIPKFESWLAHQFYFESEGILPIMISETKSEIEDILKRNQEIKKSFQILQESLSRNLKTKLQNQSKTPNSVPQEISLKSRKIPVKQK